jgi:hypothetical protein
MNTAHTFFPSLARAPSHAIYPARHGRDPAARPCPCRGAGGLARPAARLCPAFVSRPRPFAHHPLLPPRQVRGRWGVPARRGRSRPERQGDQEHSPACRPAGLREDGDAAQGAFAKGASGANTIFCAPRAVLHERAPPHALVPCIPLYPCSSPSARLSPRCPPSSRTPSAARRPGRRPPSPSSTSQASGSSGRAYALSRLGCTRPQAYCGRRLSLKGLARSPTHSPLPSPPLPLTGPSSAGQPRRGLWSSCSTRRAAQNTTRWPRSEFSRSEEEEEEEVRACMSSRAVH